MLNDETTKNSILKSWQSKKKIVIKEWWSNLKKKIKNDKIIRKNNFKNYLI
jgi:hypothetical protein